MELSRRERATVRAALRSWQREVMNTRPGSTATFPVNSAHAQEELRAELASAFVGTTLSLPTDIPQHASYIENWIKALKNDKREIFKAAADAQKIADLALSYHPDYAAILKAEQDKVSPITSLPPAVASAPFPHPG